MGPINGRGENEKFVTYKEILGIRVKKLVTYK